MYIRNLKDNPQILKNCYKCGKRAARYFAKRGLSPIHVDDNSYYFIKSFVDKIDNLPIWIAVSKWMRERR